MATLNMEVLADAVTIVEERTGLSRTDEWDTLLEQTAGTTSGGTTTYRPYGVAALIRGNAQHEAVVLAAEGVQFNSPLATLRALIATQAAWDTTLELTVPTEWSPDAIRAMVLPGSPGGVAFGKVAFS